MAEPPPYWYAAHDEAWQARIRGFNRQRDLRRQIRSEMHNVTASIADLVETGRDWTIKDEERFSTLLEEQVELLAQHRYSRNREEMFQ